MRRSGSGTGVGERPLTRHLQAGNIFSSQTRVFEGSPLVPASHSPQGSAEEGWAPEPPAFHHGRLQQTNRDTVLDSNPNSSPCSDLAGLQFPSLVSCLKRLGQTHEGTYGG